jgi:Protein of unknown function (DUF1236)
MTNRVSYGTLVLALAGAINGAVAQVGGSSQSQTTTPAIQLDAAQRAAIVTAVRDARIPPPGNRFSLSVGASVPPSIELYALPIAALSQAPEARNLRYTMVQNQVVLVDPLNMRVVDVIRVGP